MYYYQLYGLTLQSSHALPGLLSDSAQKTPDMVVHWLEQSEVAPQRNWQPVITSVLQRRRRIDLWQAKESEGIYLRLQFNQNEGLIDFIIDPLTNVVNIYWPSTLPFADVQSLFIGPVMAGLLRRRGIMCLHASVIARDHKAIAILGKKRAGKSTTSAALVQAGWQLVADDVAPLTFENGAIEVQTGYPRVRLSPDALSTLYGGVDNRPRVYSTTRSIKHYVDMPLSRAGRGPISPQTTPLSLIYLLEERTPSPKVTASLPQGRLASLVKNTAGSYMIIDNTMRTQEFSALSQVVQQVPIRHLYPPDRVEALPQLCDLILDDFQ